MKNRFSTVLTLDKVIDSKVSKRKSSRNRPPVIFSWHPSMKCLITLDREGTPNIYQNREKSAIAVHKNDIVICNEKGMIPHDVFSPERNILEERAKSGYGFPITIDSETDEKLAQIISSKLDELLVDDSRCNRNRSFVECWRYLLETRLGDEKFNKEKFHNGGNSRKRNRIYEVAFDINIIDIIIAFVFFKFGRFFRS